MNFREDLPNVNINPLDSKDDEWSEWLLHHRHADDSSYEQLVRQSVKRIRDRVLDGAQLRDSMVLVDVGAGDGHVAFGAIDRIGSSLRVICTDISAPLLRHAEKLAVERGVLAQCQFLHCAADRLPVLPDNSVDVVTTRAVLAYVDDKQAALSEFYRILKPGGRISLAEPLFRDSAYETIELRKMIEARPPERRDLFLQLLLRWKATQFPETVAAMEKNPLTNYSERDLFRFVSNVGFAETHLEFHIEQLPPLTNSWRVFLGTSPHPWAPTLNAVLEKQFNPAERQFFEQALRPIVENNLSPSTERNTYVTARKPNSKAQ